MSLVAGSENQNTLERLFDVLRWIHGCRDSAALIQGAVGRLKQLFEFDRCLLIEQARAPHDALALPLGSEQDGQSVLLDSEQISGIVTAIRSAEPHRFRSSDSSRTFLCIPTRVEDAAASAMLFEALGVERFNEGSIKIAESVSMAYVTALDRMDAADALSKAQLAIERSRQDLQEFSYVVSHDLQAPLRAVNGFCQLLSLKLHDSDDDDIRTYLTYISDGTKSMKVLINSLLEFARIDSQGDLMGLTDCNAIVQSAIASLETVIDESGAEISIAEMPSLVGDSDQLMRLFQNLIENAIKFCGTQSPHVHVTCKSDNDCWQFSVRDNGIGIDPKFSDRVFVIFQRLHAPDAYPGAGVGLAICKRIAERHGGAIFVKSEPGKGSEFYFTISKHLSEQR